VSTEPLVREPQQARSRQSFDRALDAAVALLVERGAASFTLVEVAQASGVSTGSMYGRVASKDDLIRVAHSREMERISAETVEVFASAPVDASEVERVRFAVRTLARLLQRNAPVLSPFMLLSNHDDVIATRGKVAFLEMTTQFERALVGSSAAGGARRRRAVGWACTVAYSVLARQLALGSDPGAAADYRLDQVVSELTTMITAYLAAASR
jgi:AcrR family transcriptional regulator